MAVPRHVSTPLGRASVVEEIAVEQPRFSGKPQTRIELLDVGGELLVRFAYTTDGRARRGPVTLARPDLEGLAERLGETPRLRQELRVLTAARARKRASSRSS